MFDFLQQLSTLTEDQSLTDVYSCAFNADQSEADKPGYLMQLADLGCVIQDQKIYGFRDDIQKFLRKNNFSTHRQIEKADDWTSTRMMSKLGKPDIKNLMHYFLHGKLDFALKIIGSNKIVNRCTDVFVIHRKTDKLEDLKHTGIGVSTRFGTPSEHLLYLEYPDDSTLAVKDDVNFQYIDDHFVLISSPSEIENGTYVWLIPQHGKNPDKAMAVNKTGYVRICTDVKQRHTAQFRDKHTPVGTTHEERLKNAFAAAAKWVKTQ